MSHFVIQFQKDALGENGLYTEICQSNVEINAGNKIDAAELAKKKLFAKMKEFQNGRSTLIEYRSEKQIFSTTGGTHDFQISRNSPSDHRFDDRGRFGANSHDQDHHR